MGEIAKLWATIGADTAGLKKGLSDTDRSLPQSKSELGKFSLGLGALKPLALGAGVALGAAAGGLAYALKDCVDAAMEAGNIQAELNAVLKSTPSAAA